VPSWFRATCHEASSRGANSYGFAGKQLGRHVGHEIPHSLEEIEWDAEVEVLRGHCEERDLAQIKTWLLEHYPAMMKIVPSRRPDAVAAGVLDAYRETEGLAIE